MAKVKPSAAAALKDDSLVESKFEGQIVRISQVRGEEVKTTPTKKHPNDAGYDLVCSQNTVVSVGTKAMVPTNIALQIPEDLFALILPRSSAFYKSGLIVHPGTIDPDYRGEIQVLVWNPTNKAVYLGEGDSIAQLIFLPRYLVRFSDQKLTPTERGGKGFGSTGRVPGAAPEENLQP